MDVHGKSNVGQLCEEWTWAAQYNTGLLIKLMSEGAGFS